jgi:DNA modification methylase
VQDQVREQLPLWQRSGPEIEKAGLRDAAAGENKSLPVHRWVPWIAGFSAPFVEDVIAAYLPENSRERSLVLDPFTGVATTLVEALKAGCDVVGYEINAFAALAARAKIDCVDVPPEGLSSEIEAFRTAMLRFEAQVDLQYGEGGASALTSLLEELRESSPPGFKSRIPFFSPPVEAKFLYALRRTAVLHEPDRALFRAALGATMISYSNYSYEPSLGTRPGAGKPLIENASVGYVVCAKLDEMRADVEWAQDHYGPTWRARRRTVHHASYFDSTLAPETVSLVVTSPPYMNNYHYVRNTRPQLHWLDLLGDTTSMRQLEEVSFGKFWQTVRQGPPVRLAFDFPELDRVVEHLRAQSPVRGQYGGSGWASYVATYFNDSQRLFESLERQLRPDGHAVIVVGNSIIQGVEFRVDHLLAQMAERLGLRVVDVQIVRTKRVGNSIIDSAVRIGEAGHKQRTQLYDAAVILRK